MVSGSNAGFAGTAQPQSMKWWSGAWRANTFKSAVRAAVRNSADAPCWCSSRRPWSWSLIYNLVTFIPLNLLHRRRTEPCQLLIFLTGGTGSWYEFLKVLYIVSFPCLAVTNWFILGKGVRPLYHTPLFISVTGSCVCKYLQHKTSTWPVLKHRPFLFILMYFSQIDPHLSQWSAKRLRKQETLLGRCVWDDLIAVHSR